MKKKWESMGGSAGIAREGATISACQVPVKHLVFPGGPKSGICEVGMEVSLGENCFNCHGSL